MEYFFLSDKEYKKYKLFKTVMNNTGIEMRHIKDHLTMSSTSIRRCLHELNEELTEVFPKKNISIQFSGTGYSVISDTMPTSFLLDSMKLFYIKQSNEFIILNMLISKRFASVNQLSLQINISPSHLYKYIKNIRIFLSKFNLGIDFSYNDTTNSSLIGNKMDKLYFLNVYYWDIYKAVEWPPFIMKDQSLCPTTSLSPFQERRVHYIRSISKHLTIKNCSFKPDSDLKNICDVFKSFNHHLIDQTELNLPEDPTELLENFFMRLFIPEFDSDVNKLHISQQISELSNNKIVMLSTIFLKSLFDFFAIIPSESQYTICFYYSLIIHIFLNYVNTDFFTNLDVFPKLRELSTEDLSFVELEKSLLHFYEELSTKNKDYPLKLSKANLIYMGNFCYFLLDYCTETQKIKIYVELSKNTFSTQMIKKNLLAIFGHDNIELTDVQTQATIILTDFFQEGMDQEKICHFDNPYSNDSWSNVLSVITSTLYKKKSFITKYTTQNDAIL